jgi:thiol-disulfide isomerase/thioredoxin
VKINTFAVNLKVKECIMKKFFSPILVVAIISMLVFENCSKGGGGGGGTTNTTVILEVNKTSVRADGFDEIVMTAKDQNGADITASCVFKIDGTNFTSNRFHTLAAGNHVLAAVKSGSKSADLTVTATNPGPSPFTKKVLVEDYTGTWCGYCPRVGVQLTNYSASHPNCIVVGVHGPAGSSDPYNYQYVSQLTTTFGVTGWPTAIVNRDYKWNENNNILDAEGNKRAPLGIAFETSVVGTTINVKTKVKFDVTTSLPLKLVVLLVQDNLVYSQVNYYAPTYGGNPIANYVHNHVLRAAATDIFGDAIPSASQTSGTTWESNLSFNASAYNISNCKIVAMVLSNTLGYDYKGALNAQIVTAGQNKDFD